jgi:hypothetical protein
VKRGPDVVSERRAPLRILAFAGLVAAIGALGPVDVAGAADRANRAALPPPDRAALVRIFRPLVAPLGLRLTRAALVDADDHRSPTGTHLALYVEPVATYTPAQYVDGVVTVTQVFLPRVFRRWGGLRSFDVCQEPPASVDASAEPPPETQVFVRRRGVRAVDWRNVDLAEILAAARRAGRESPVALSVYVAQHLHDVPAYASAEAEARATSKSRYR